MPSQKNIILIIINRLLLFFIKVSFNFIGLMAGFKEKVNQKLLSLNK